MSLLRYLSQEDHSEARGFYLEAWAGNTSYDFSRIGRGEILVPHLSFSLIGSTQPGVLSAFVAESSRDESNDGMLQRFGMMVWPDGAEEFEFIDRAVDSTARDNAYAAFDRLDQLDVDDAGAQRSMNFDMPWLPFASDAYQAFKAWRIGFENELRSGKIGSPSLEAHLAKYRKLVPVLALIRHLADGGTGPVISTRWNRLSRGPISRESRSENLRIDRRRRGESGEGDRGEDQKRRSFGPLSCAGGRPQKVDGTDRHGDRQRRARAYGRRPLAACSDREDRRTADRSLYHQSKGEIIAETGFWPLLSVMF